MLDTGFIFSSTRLYLGLDISSKFCFLFFSIDRKVPKLFNIHQFK